MAASRLFMLRAVATFALTLRHHDENVRNAKLLAKLALETGEVPMHPNDPRRSPVDAVALRGLPAIGRGIGNGAIRGTVPGANLR
jgi:hypothetical protein